MDIYTFIVMLHVIGTILGTGGATIAEIQITRALKDNKVSKDEGALMHANYSLIRVGMAIIFVSILGMYWYYDATGSNVLFTSEKLWIKDLMFVMIVLNAIALQKRWVPLWLGASISFTSWWGATLLGLAGQLPYSFTTYLIGYILAIFVMAGLFHVLRLLREKEILTGRVTLISFLVILIGVAGLVYYLIQGETAREAAEQAEQGEVAAEYRQLTETVSFEYPGGSHTIQFEFYLDEQGVIQRIEGADVDPDNQGRIASFVSEVNTMLVGTQFSALGPLEKVGGASLTTGAFNEAVERLQVNS